MAGPFLGPDLHAVGREFQTGAPVRLPVDDDEAVEADADSAEQSARVLPSTRVDSPRRRIQAPAIQMQRRRVWPGYRKRNRNVQSKAEKTTTSHI